ncbi:MBOAT-domain-containing protein [Annulohypoxylon maeteangense]|uniref:MBOAT-domain-containing protein n=1 Tax=Annulohypoxylon maeteangense TaxID=1927788 RepID=UPI00200788E4|nr:MBOAT-domain-containing protein [Annulohypoxylon maeteangense]KAI0881469.1 MBOAT-domain-containing protein [Annulohypoxylon maeteangense]
MGVFSFLRNIYDLDTLDTRFTISTSTPYKTVIEARNDPIASKERAAKLNSKAHTSRWNTSEFYLYYLILLWVIPYMFWVAYDSSRPTDPKYRRYEHLLSEGWIPGRKIDASDSQYRTFRNNIPYMAALLIFHPLLRRLYNSIVYPIKTTGQSTRPTPEEADQRLNQRASFDFGFALIYLVALHGVSAFKILVILYANYQVATALPRKYVPAATWIFNVGTLFSNELCKGYKFGHIATLIAGAPVQNSLLDSGSALVSWGRWLDSYGGLMGRWEILFNITVLRLISFNLDYYWSLDRRSYSPIEKQVDPASLSERDRVSIPAQSKDFSFRNYLAYTIYGPLYLTGPIITFNDYISQLRYKSSTIEVSRTLRYGVRFLLTLLAMEVILHYDYVQAISKANPGWGEYTAAQLSILSYFNLHLIWLKLLLPWRLFRLWALIDGVDPPENMIRCVSDNWSTLAFWRSWHRSFYRWSLRYIYVPLGGSSFRSPRDAARSILTYVLVFTFVALWHDIQMRLLIWGWLVVFFMLPEMAAGFLFPKRKWESRPTAYRMLCCVGAVANVFMMMSANLVGFAVGVEGLERIIAGIFRDFSGLTFLSGACIVLFVGVQAMFEIRESEMRRGINLKC